MQVSQETTTRVVDVPRRVGVPLVEVLLVDVPLDLAIEVDHDLLVRPTRTELDTRRLAGGGKLTQTLISGVVLSFEDVLRGEVHTQPTQVPVLFDHLREDSGIGLGLDPGNPLLEVAGSRLGRGLVSLPGPLGPLDWKLMGVVPLDPIPALRRPVRLELGDGIITTESSDAGPGGAPVAPWRTGAIPVRGLPHACHPDDAISRTVVKDHRLRSRTGVLARALALVPERHLVALRAVPIGVAVGGVALRALPTLGLTQLSRLGIEIEIRRLAGVAAQHGTRGSLDEGLT